MNSKLAKLLFPIVAFSLSLVAIGCSGAKVEVSFNQNYEGAPAVSKVSIAKGSTVPEPKDPTRSGFTFNTWSESKDSATPFSFATVINEDKTLYAHWISGEVTLHTVTFDLNYSGSTNFKEKVYHNATVSKPSEDPIREGHEFVKWIDSASNEYDFSTKITADITIRAEWNFVSGEINRSSFLEYLNRYANNDRPDVSEGLKATVSVNSASVDVVEDDYNLVTLDEFEPINSIISAGPPISSIDTTTDSDNIDMLFVQTAQSFFSLLTSIDFTKHDLLSNIASELSTAMLIEQSINMFVPYSGSAYENHTYKSCEWSYFVSETGVLTANIVIELAQIGIAVSENIVAFSNATITTSVTILPNGLLSKLVQRSLNHIRTAGEAGEGYRTNITTASELISTIEIM